MTGLIIECHLNVLACCGTQDQNCPARFVQSSIEELRIRKMTAAHSMEQHELQISITMNCFRHIKSGTRGARLRPESVHTAGRYEKPWSQALLQHGRTERYTTTQGTGQLQAAVARAEHCRITIRSWHGPAKGAPQPASTRPQSKNKQIRQNST